MAEESAAWKSLNGNKKKVPFYKLFSFADRIDVAFMIAGTIGAIGNGISQPTMTVIFGKLINAFGYNDGESNILQEIQQVCIYYVYLAVGSGICSFLGMLCWMISGERQAARIRGLYLKTLLKQDISFFDTQTTTGEVISRMSADTVLIQQAMGEKVGKFIQLSSTFFGGLIVGFAKGWFLALVLCSCIPALVVAGRLMSSLMSKISTRVQIGYADAGNVLEQTIGGIRTVASLTGEQLAIKKYDSKLQTAYKSTAKEGMVSGIGMGTMLMIIFGSYAIAIYYGSKLVVTNGYKGGDVINVILAIMMGGLSLCHASPCLNAFAAGQSAAFKMFETIARVPSIDSYDARGIVLENMKGEIDFKDVHFKYPARPDAQIFAGFSLHIPFGTTAAVVGHSGSGKSTVISLLERFYDPQAGEVLIDGVNLKKMQIKSLREKLGLVSQEPILFATSIKENIMFGKADATGSEIRTAIELANAAEFIDKLPKGLDTLVGEHGTQLSGGQKQRIAIARAIIKNPRIILFDEATSALDAGSEHAVQGALDQIMANRTTVVVAHRLTTIRNADLIAVVHAGKLVEQGTHSELMKEPNGAYYQLFHPQEGSKQTSEKPTKSDLEKVDASMDFDDGSSQRMSLVGFTSKGSSGRSFTVKLGDEDVIEHEVLRTSKKVSLVRILSLNKPELAYLVFGSLAACVGGVVFPVFGLLLAKAVRVFFSPPHELRKDSKFWSLIFLSLGVVNFVITPVQNYLFGIAGSRLIQRIRSLSFKKVVHREIGWFDDPANSSGAVGARLSTDASTLKSVVGDALALVVQNVSTIVAGLLIAFITNWILALVVLAALPFIGLQGFLQVKFHTGVSRDGKIMYEEASQVANDAVGSIRTVASFCAEEKMISIYQRKCEVLRRDGVRRGVISGLAFGFGSASNFLATAFCFWIGARLITSGKATFDDVFKVFFALTMAADGVSQAMALTPDINKAKLSAASIFEILDAGSKIDSSSDEGQVLGTVKGDIELQHIHFKYPTRPDIQILKDLCLTISSGKTVALVGESGSGKSTVISLIERFYDPDSGHIYLDGVELKLLRINWLRQQMSLVCQEPILFDESIRANIAYGGKQGDASEEEIVAAARAANAHGFVSGLPRGYETRVGERGVQLSGGQKQRIAIARAIIKDPRILLLDEATSALDAESERVVQDALVRVMASRTSVVVTHRLCTVKGADIIAVVRDGAIVEEGGHDELMGIQGGVYASLVAFHTTDTA